MKKTLITLGIVLLALFGFVSFQQSQEEVINFGADSGATDAGAVHASSNWNTPTNALGSNNQRTYSTNASNSLDVDTFGFAIPTGATINGIEVHIEGLPYGVSGERISLQLRKTAGLVGSVQNVTFTNFFDVTETQGSSSDLWGTTWTEAEIESADFGVRLIGLDDETEVDNVSITVYYTEAGGSTSVTTSNATSILQTSANLNGEVTDTASETNFAIGFEYGIDSIFSATTTTFAATSSIGVFFENISSLTTFEEYGFRAFASSTAPQYGDTYQFFTGDISTSTPRVSADNHAHDYSVFGDGTHATTTVSGTTLVIDGVASTQPLIEAGDATESGNNITATAMSIAYPAYVSGDLLIGLVDMSLTAGLTISLPAMPNGETPVIAENALGADVVNTVMWYWVGTGTETSGNLAATASGNTRWTGAVLKIPAGEFDSANPISNASTTQQVSSGTTPGFPTFSANSDDTNGTVVAFISVDVDPISTTPTGWTDIVDTDRGRASIVVSTRDAAVTSSESITGVNWTIASDAYANKAFIVRAPPATYEEGYWISPAWDVGSITNVGDSWLEVSSTTASGSAVEIAIGLNTSATVPPTVASGFSTTTNLSSLTGVTGDLTGKYLWTLVWLTPTTALDDTPSVTEIIWGINQGAVADSTSSTAQSVIWFD